MTAYTRKLHVVIDYVNLGQAPCYSLRQIDSFNYAPKDLPILRDRYLRKGVYLSFSQFKRNSPAYSSFGLTSDREVDIIYVKGKNIADSIVDGAWGFCDGEKLFIRYGQNFYPLIRTGDNFEFLAKIITTDPPLFNNGYIPRTNYSSPLELGLDAAVTGLLSRIKTRSEDRRLYILNMETGRIIRP